MPASSLSLATRSKSATLTRSSTIRRATLAAGLDPHLRPGGVAYLRSGLGRPSPPSAQADPELGDAPAIGLRPMAGEADRRPLAAERRVGEEAEAELGPLPGRRPARADLQLRHLAAVRAIEDVGAERADGGGRGVGEVPETEVVLDPAQHRVVVVVGVRDRAGLDAGGDHHRTHLAA